MKSKGGIVLKTFRTYQLAVEFYKLCESVKMKYHLKHQLLRASSSIVLNLAEGSSKPTRKDKLKFYFISLCSCREVQSILDLHPHRDLFIKADYLGACLYKLCHAPQPPE